MKPMAILVALLALLCGCHLTDPPANQGTTPPPQEPQPPRDYTIDMAGPYVWRDQSTYFAKRLYRNIAPNMQGVLTVEEYPRSYAQFEKVIGTVIRYSCYEGNIYHFTVEYDTVSRKLYYYNGSTHAYNAYVGQYDRWKYLVDTLKKPRLYQRQLSGATSTDTVANILDLYNSIAGSMSDNFLQGVDSAYIGFSETGYYNGHTFLKTIGNIEFWPLLNKVSMIRRDSISGETTHHYFTP